MEVEAAADESFAGCSCCYAHNLISIALEALFTLESKTRLNLTKTSLFNILIKLNNK